MNKTPLMMPSREQALQAFTNVKEWNLSRPIQFDQISFDTFLKIYNGIGPDNWPEQARDVLSWLCGGFPELPAIHDVDCTYSDGTEAGFCIATERWHTNGSIILEKRFPLKKVWLWPARFRAWRRIHETYLVLKAYSFPYWKRAHERREQEATNG